MPPIMFFSNFPISYARWASTPMMYQQCNCNNNGNNQWLNWWMMSEMVKNIGQMFRKPEKQPPIPYAYNPYQQYTQPYQTMYPYVNLNNTQQYPITEQDEGLRDLQEAYKNCKTKFNFVKVNDKYIAIDKDGKRIKADTAEELMELIDAKVDGKGGVEHEGDETAELREEIESLREQVSTLEAEKAELEKAKEGKDGKEIVKPGQVPQGWGNGISLLNVDSNHKNLKHGYKGFYSNRQTILHNKDKAADTTINLLLLNSGLEINDETKRDALKQALINANTSIYNGEGKLLDGVDSETLNTKLHIPTAGILTSTYGARSKQALNSSIGSIKDNIKIGDQTYSQGVEWQSSGIKLYKNQPGDWSNFDRDAILLIDNKKYKFHKIITGNTERGEAADYGDITGTNDVPNCNPIFKHDNNGHLLLINNLEDKFAIKNEKGETIGKLYSKDNKTIFEINNHKYDMEKILSGEIKL